MSFGGRSFADEMTARDMLSIGWYISHDATCSTCGDPIQVWAYKARRQHHYAGSYNPVGGRGGVMVPHPCSVPELSDELRRWLLETGRLQ